MWGLPIYQGGGISCWLWTPGLLVGTCCRGARGQRRQGALQPPLGWCNHIGDQLGPEVLPQALPEGSGESWRPGLPLVHCPAHHHPPGALPAGFLMQRKRPRWAVGLRGVAAACPSSGSRGRVASPPGSAGGPQDRAPGSRWLQGLSTGLQGSGAFQSPRCRFVWDGGGGSCCGVNSTCLTPWACGRA